MAPLTFQVIAMEDEAEKLKEFKFLLVKFSLILGLG